MPNLTHIGSNTNPLRVAIIGSGPSAFYAAEHLIKQSNLTVTIDMFERLPTPFGLVRGGVAPDHPKIKSVTRVYDRIARRENFRFFGNVTFGQDITHDDIHRHYHAVIYAVGAQTDRQMDIPGEGLPGSHAATEFVGWYNGHPDYRDLTFNLQAERVAVIGNGNVAMDVVRMLAHTREELEQTDVVDYALEALAASTIKEIYILGRRGPAQAKFTTPELRELSELAAADIIIDPTELELDPLSAEWLEDRKNRTAQKNLDLMREYAQQPPAGSPIRIIMKFLVSPHEIRGDGQVQYTDLTKNEICVKEHFLRPCPTDETETLPVDLIFRSIGYHGVPLPGLPFDDWAGIIPNSQGRIIDEHDNILRGSYVVGWIKRGPTGIIGTNKPDAQETVNLLVEDVAAEQLLEPENPDFDAIPRLLAERDIRYVTFADWELLDQMEQERGAAVGRPRLKFSRVEDMLAALAARKEQPEPATD